MINNGCTVKECEKSLYKAVFDQCLELVRGKHVDIAEAVDQMSGKFGSLVEDVENLRNWLFQEITADTQPAVTYINPTIPDKTWWSRIKNSDACTGGYWERYYDYLNKKNGWSIKSVNDLDAATDDMMNASADPRKNIELERRGLAFGYVQSGKTANYIGLINKSLDAGYKVVIVLTGIHNSLRSQTQSRIDEEVLGYDTSTENGELFKTKENKIGVGLNPHFLCADQLSSFTTRDEKGDFNNKIKQISIYPPFIIVTKKNSTVLESIISYFTESPFSIEKDGHKVVPAKYPLLLIDDEADQASLNTKKEDPSTINRQIRDLLASFECKTYVGFTATPYANIFIPPHATSADHGDDLFPRDFIIRTPRPDLYVGAKEFFGIQDDLGCKKMPLFIDIKDDGNYLGKGTKSGDAVGPIPEKMKEAIRYFFISTAIRNCRGQRNKPNTMLIHVARYTSQQHFVKSRVDEYKSELTSYIVNGDSEIKNEFMRIYEDEYIPTSRKMRMEFAKYMAGANEVSWDQVWKEIYNLAIDERAMLVYEVNGKSSDSLIYKNHEGESFNVIVIGGDKLSRGLTLEGLTVSYFTRSANTADTLMQMGRWFGFRPQYLDVCRLFTTKALFGSFRYVSFATEDLASQFDVMNGARLSPATFGLKVATSPTILLSSRNKIRTGVEYTTDYSCTLTQTRLMDDDAIVVNHNYKAVEAFLMALNDTGKRVYAPYESRCPSHFHCWEKVDGGIVASFMESYQTSSGSIKSNSKSIAAYIREMNKYSGLTDFTVCLVNVNKTDSESVDHPHYGKYCIAGCEGLGITRTGADTTDVLNDGITDLHTLTSDDHEYIDFSNEQYKEVCEMKQKKNNAKTIRSKLRAFEKGLLILYPIADVGNGELTKHPDNHKIPIGFAIVFPDRKNVGKLPTYRLNEVALEIGDDDN